MYDLTRLRYSSWSIFVRAYPTMRMFLGRKLLRCYRLSNLGAGSCRRGTYKAEERGELLEVSIVADALVPRVLTVFFFARSPDAPRTTMMVLSLSSMLLHRKDDQPSCLVCFEAALSTFGSCPSTRTRNPFRARKGSESKYNGHANPETPEIIAGSGKRPTQR